MFLDLFVVCNHWPLGEFCSGFYCEWGPCCDDVICNVKSEWFTPIQCTLNDWRVAFIWAFWLTTTGAASESCCLLERTTRKRRKKKESVSNSLERETVWSIKWVRNRKFLVALHFLFTLFKQERRENKKKKNKNAAKPRSKLGHVTFWEICISDNCWNALKCAIT